MTIGRTNIQRCSVPIAAQYERHRHTEIHVTYNIRTSAYTMPGSLDPTGLRLTDKLTINISVENFTN